MYSKFTKHKSARLITAVMLVFIAISGNLKAQLTGTKNIPGDYATLGLAITDLNTVGVGAGGVTFNLLAGNPQTAPAGGYSITASGIAANPIIFQGNANSVTAPTPQASGVLNDAIFKIIGGDYITISGFSMAENAANTTTAAATNNMTEFGVALFYATATDGAQNISITSNTITLNRAYQNTFGIYANSTHNSSVITTAAVATGTLGGTSNLAIYSNSISNVNIGIVVVGPAAAADHNQGLDIGGNSSSQGNIITNYGTTNVFSGYVNVSGSVNGILVRNTGNYNISNNTITSSAGGTTAGTLRGIFVPAFTAAPAIAVVQTVNNNTVSVRSGVSAALQGIVVEATTSNSLSTLSISNNNFNTIGHTVASTAAITLISNAVPVGSLTVNANTFNNLSVNTSGNVTFISHSYSIPVTGIAVISNNAIVTAFTKTTAGGTVFFSSTNGSSGTGSINNYLNNNFSNITVTGGTAITGINNTDGGAGSAKTITGNIFSNWIGGTSAITAINTTYLNGVSTYSNNLISNITSQSTITGINIGSVANNATSFSVSSNTVSSLSSTGTAGAVTGITCSNTSALINISKNTIFTCSSNAAASVTGITISGSTATNVFKNKIYDLSSSNAGGSAIGITSSGGNTNTIHNNIIGDLRAPIASAANALIGINVTGGTTVNTHFNTVYLNGSSTGANFGSSAFWAGGTPGTVNLNNNIFVNNSTPNGTGITAAVRRAGAILTNYGASSNNNLLYAGTASTVNAIYYDGATTYSTLAAFKTAVGPTREAASVSENPSFTSTVSSSADFLHFNAATNSVAESGAVNISGITDDFDADIRQGNAGYAGTGSSPDIGADEFEGTSPAPAINSLSVTPSVTQCTAISRDVFASVSAGVASLVSVTLNYSFNGTAQTPITMVGGNLTGTSTWSATIPTAIPTNATVTWNVVVTDGTYTKLSNGVSYSDEPANGVAIAATANPNPICEGSAVSLALNLGAPTLTYCAFPAGSSSSSYFDGFSTTGGVSNITNNASGFSANNYGNFTNLVVSQKRGQAINYNSILFGTTVGAAIWVDFDQNGLFDAYEKVANTTGYVSAFAGSFIVPASAKIGATRMRIIMDWNSTNPAAPCGPLVSGRGEVEDYQFFVLPATTLSYEWADGVTSFTSATTPSTLTINTTTSYTGTAYIDGCALSSTVQVNVTPLPSVPLVTDRTQCGVGVSASNVTGGVAYNWYATPTSTAVLQSGASATYTTAIGVTTSFYVTSVNGTCESTPRAQVTTTVSIPDGVIAASSSTNLCVGGSNAITLTATQTGTTNPYTFSWEASPVSGSGMPSSVTGSVTSVTPTLPGTYSYSVTATDGICTTVSSVNVNLNSLPVILTANASPTIVCSGETVNFNTPTAAATYSLPPAVSSPTADEDFANITITQGATTILNNTTANNSLVGTIGVATGTVGSYSNFTSFGAYLLIPGQTYSFSASSSTSGTAYGNALAIFIDYNRNGVFTDAGEQVYTSPATISGAHTRAGSFTVPASANIGLTRMRVVSNEGLISSPTQAISWGEYEEYLINLNQDISLYTWQWNPGAINGYTASTVVTNTTSVTQTQNFTVTASSTLTGCSNTATVDVVVNPIPTTPIATNSIQCGFGVPTASVSGGTSYNWYATPTSTSVLQSGSSSTFTTSIGATTSWYVSSISPEGCISPLANVTQSVTIPDGVTASSSSTNLCVGGSNSITLTATQIGTTNPYTFSWSASPASGSGIPSSVSGTTTIVTPTLPGTYIYSVTATDGFCTTVSSVNVTLNALPEILTANVLPTAVCSGETVTFNTPAQSKTYSLPPAVSSPTADEDFANITITQGATSILNNTTANNSLVGTIGVATGTVGSYSDFTSFGPYLLVPGQTYNFSASSSTSGTSYGNALAIFIDYNRNGVYTDAGEQVYTSAATTLGAHTETGNFTVPASANIGLTRMRVVSNEGLITSPAQAISWGEYEEYLINLNQDISLYTWQWNPGAINGYTASTVVTNTTNVTQTQNFTVTASSTLTGCSNTATVDVVVNPIPTTPIATNSIQCGFGVPTASVSGGSLYYWYATPTSTVGLQSGSTYSTSIGATTSWYVSSISPEGCTSPLATVTQSVTIPDALAATASSTNLCIGSNAITLTAIKTGTANTYAYTWTAPLGSGIAGSVSGATVSVTPNFPSVYTYTVTGVDGNCTNIATVDVTINNLPDITSATASPSAICSGSSFTLNANSIISGPQVVPTGYCATSNSGGNCINLVSINTLNYTAGCIGAAPNYLDVPSTSATTNLTPGQSYFLSLTTSGSAIASVWFDWNKDGLFDASEWYQPFTTGTSGTSNVTVPLTAAGGLTKMRVRTRAAGNTNGAINSCTSFGSGETHDYTINIQTDNSASYNWTWNPGSVNSNTLVTSLTNTTASGFTQTYSVSATSSVTGCSNTALVDVVVNPIPATPSVADASQCGLGVPSASVNGGAAYNWYATPTSTLVLQTGASSNFTSSISNTTSWNVASTNGFCESPRVVLTQTVVAPPALTINTPAAICGGNGIGTFSVTSNLSDYGSYVWSPTTGLFTDAAATVPYTGGDASSLFVQSSAIGVLTYSVVSTNSVTGCGNETTSTITIKESPASITLTAVPNPLCAGSTVSLSATANTFSTAVYNETFNGATNNWIAASTSTGGTPTNADWTVRVSPYSSGVGTNITSNDASQFYMTDSDAQGSGGTTSTTLQSPAINTNGLATLNMSFYHYYNNFGGDSTLLQVSTNGTSWTTLVNYSTLGVDVGTAQNFALETVNLNAYVGNSTLYVRYKYNSSYGWGWAIDNVKLVGNADNTYSWTSNPVGFAASTSTVTDVPAGNTTYSVVITNTATSCSNSAAISVSVNPIPVVTAVSSSSAVCAGSSATLTAGGATTYTWSSGDNTAVAAVTPTALSVYTVTGEALGCSGTNTVSVDVIALPTIVATAANASVCPNATATLTASGAVSYTWSSGGTSSTELVTVNSASTYTVTGEDLGCTNTTTVAVGLNPVPTVLATASQTLLCDDGSTGSSVLTASTTATSYLWSDGAITMTTAVTPTLTTTYTVTVTELGCSADAFVTVNVSNCNGVKELAVSGIDIYPNPTNGILNISIYKELLDITSIELYDAIGKLVIKETLSSEITSINTFKLADGMYVYKIINNNKAIKIGKIVKH